MKSCERYELLASLVLDGEADEAERSELTAHLEVCPECRAYFEDIKRIHESFAREEAVVPEGFSAQVMDRVRGTKQDRREKSKKIITFPHWRRWTALAACCAVVVLSIWAFRSVPDRAESVTADAAPRMAVNAGSETAGASQEPEAQLADEGPAADDEAPVEALPEPPAAAPAALQEEDTERAKSAVRDGAGQSQPQAGSVQASSQEPEQAAALPEPGPAIVDHEEPKNDEGGRAEDNMEPGQQLEYEDSGAEESPEAPALESPEEPEDADVPAETEEPMETEAPAEDEDPAEPVEVIGVPEPGIVVAYGPAAQSWVEDVLGLEWAVGGSYPLTAEQYSGLLETLDVAGEPYSVAGGEDYCLMTE